MVARRKKLVADARKEAKKSVYMARLVNNPTSPRKTRIMAILNGGTTVNENVCSGNSSLSTLLMQPAGIV